MTNQGNPGEPTGWCDVCRAIMERAAETAVPYSFGSLCDACQKIVLAAYADTPPFNWLANMPSIKDYIGTAPAAVTIRIGPTETRTFGETIAPPLRLVAEVATVQLPPGMGAPIKCSFCGSAERLGFVPGHGSGVVCATCGWRLMFPAPWKWDDDGFDLRAANGSPLIKAEHDDIGTVVTAFVSFESPWAKALTEAAPELEALVRSRARVWPCSFCRDLPDKPAEVTDHAPSCPAAALLARIDERSKGG